MIEEVEAKNSKWILREARIRTVKEIFALNGKNNYTNIHNQFLKFMPRCYTKDCDIFYLSLFERLTKMMKIKVGNFVLYLV